LKKQLQELPSEWGGQLEILALEKLLDVNIKIEGHKYPITQNGQIRIILFYENGNHYEFGVEGMNVKKEICGFFYIGGVFK